MTELETKKLEAFELIRKIGKLTAEMRQLQQELQKIEEKINELEKV